MFEFQGQEIQDELGLNWQSFKWRNHNPALGRFFNIDPLAEDYVYNSTYAFSENRVIDGVELEGLEYVNANKARLVIQKNGNVSLNMSNMSEITYMNFAHVNNYSQNWSPGTIGASSINTQVGKMDFTAIMPKSDIGRGMISSETKIRKPIAVSTGREDRRFTKDRFIGDGFVNGSKAVGASRTLLTIEGLKFGYKGLSWLSAQYDKSITENQLDFLRLAGSDLQMAISDGMIPEEYLNVSDLSVILNVIFSGDNYTDDPHLTSIGVTIYNTYNERRSSGNMSKRNRELINTIRRDMRDGSSRKWAQ